MTAPVRLSAFGKKYIELVDRIVSSEDSNEKLKLKNELAKLIGDNYEKERTVPHEVE